MQSYPVGFPTILQCIHVTMSRTLPPKYRIQNKKYLHSLLLGIWYLVLGTRSVYASNWQTSNSDDPATFKDLEAVFQNILGVLVPFAGITIFIMFLIGGYQFMFSGGDPQKSAAARGTLTWAVVGLLFLLGAWLILRFIQEFTGVNVTVFQIPE